MKTKDMAYIALMAVLISVCSWLSVPAAIPFTMQTYAVFTALLLLGALLTGDLKALVIALDIRIIKSDTVVCSFDLPLYEPCL